MWLLYPGSGHEYVCVSYYVSFYALMVSVYYSDIVHKIARDIRYSVWLNSGIRHYHLPVPMNLFESEAARLSFQHIPRDQIKRV